jgi:sporulation protein YlmC with PRC-barrel domain
MRRSNITLTKAIELAEGHANGQALDASVRSAPGSGMLSFDVIVLDRSNRLQVVHVDGSSARVTGMDAYPGGKDAHGVRAARIIKATDVSGRDIKNAAGQEIGEIEELAIDVGRGRIAYAVVELTRGENRLIAVPWSSLKHHENHCQLDLAADRRVGDAPAVEQNSWPDMTTVEFDRRLSDFYQTRPYGQDAQVPPGRTFQIMKASDIVGGDVRSSTGEDLGSIDDLALDLNSSRVAYAVVSFGGILGIGDKLFAIPMESFTRNADDKWVLAVTKERLKDAPGFDKKNWPNMADPAFDTRMREFYRPGDAGRDMNTGGTPQQPPAGPGR